VRAVIRRLRHELSASNGNGDGRPGVREALAVLTRRVARYPVKRDLDRLRFSIGSLEARHARAAPTIREAEFQAFSQNGEDGIIQWLIARVPIERDVFVEIGVHDYSESNTRFLLEHDNWAGLILNGGMRHVAFVRATDLGWRHTIDARSAFVTAENINGLLEDVAGDIGLLSIDIDGNEYWVWSAIEIISPRIVVIEYNSIFGRDRAVTVPYDPAFERGRAHFSGLYSGASLAALCHLAERKGYSFAGANKAGVNAFFVRKDVSHAVPAVSAHAGFVGTRMRVSRDRHGRLMLVGPHEMQRELMAELPLIDVETGDLVAVGDLQG
jgi:hypothetical protein